MKNIERKIFISDYDNTIAITKDRVEEACKEVIFKLYGSDIKKRYIENLGGLQNRSPDELIHRLFPKKDIKEVGEMTDEFAEKKLDILYGQIGKDWPKVTEGFVDFYNYLQEKGIDFAIVSSGHTNFINKFFETNGLVLPKIIISNDELADRHYLSVLSRNKPSVFPLMLAHKQWLSNQNMMGVNFDMETVRESKKRIIYLGDDLNKDGLMAKNAQILFGHYKNNNRFKGIYNGRFSFGNFREIISLIENNVIFRQ